MMTKKIQRLFLDYSSYHQTVGNKLTHVFGIPFILLGLLSLLSSLKLPVLDPGVSLYFRSDLGIWTLACASLWYLILDWKIAIPFSFVLIGIYFFGRAISLPWNLLLFVTGWILQGIGHTVFERNRPAFFKNFTHLLIGPLWIFASFVGYYRSIDSKLKQESRQLQTKE